MERGLYIAATGMTAEMVRQDQLANDLANATTPGYKQDRAVQRSFGELLLAEERSGRNIGPLGAGAWIAGQETDLRPATLRETGEPLDLAIDGEGFFAVQTDAGVRFTRNGRFGARADGTLVDQLGNPVLDTNRRALKVGTDGKPDPTRIGVFTVRDPEKAGEGLFSGTAAGAAAGTARSGYLEASGVDAARTMVDMIASLRSFEASQRVITTIDDTLQKAASQVGNLG